MPDHKARVPGLSGLAMQVWLLRSCQLLPHAHTDRQMDGQTAVVATVAPGCGQASHGFALLLWLWALSSISPPFPLSLGAFRYGRCKCVAACSGELLCLQASSAW